MLCPQGVLEEVVQHRQQNVDNFTNALSLAPAHLPWTAAAGPQGLNDSLMLQQSLTCDYGTRMAADKMSRNVLYDQLVSLVDIILDGYKSHLKSIRGTSRENILFKQYQVDRHKVIAPLVIDKEWEKAALLGQQETELVTGQKTMLSMSKLAKLAAPDSEDKEDYIDYKDLRLELIAFQEDVPDYVLHHYGYDTLKPKVIPPKDLIHLNTCSEYKEASEVEFKKALDLLDFVDDEELRSQFM